MPRVKAIALGGATCASLPLGGAPEPPAEHRTGFDWATFLARAHFSPAERALFEIHWRGGVPISRLPARLGLTAREVRRLHAEVLAKLRGPAGVGCLSIEPLKHSLRPVFRARIRPGMRVWSLAQLDENFLDVMNREKYFYLYSQRDPAVNVKKSKIWGPGYRSTLMQTSDAMNSTLRAEETRLTRVSELLHSARRAHEKTEADLERARAEAQDDRVQAILEDRPSPGPELAKRIASLDEELKACEAQLAAATEAHGRQCAVIDGLRAEIEGRRYERFLQELDGPARVALKLVEKLASAVADVQQIALKHGVDSYGLASALYPPSPDGISGSSRRLTTLGVLSAAAAAARYIDQRAAKTA